MGTVIALPFNTSGSDDFSGAVPDVPDLILSAKGNAIAEDHAVQMTQQLDRHQQMAKRIFGLEG